MKFDKLTRGVIGSSALFLAVSSNAAVVAFVDLQQTEAGDLLAAQAGADVHLATNAGDAFYAFTSGGLDFNVSAGGGGIIVGRGANNGRTNTLPSLSQPDLYADMWVGRNGNGTVSLSIDGFSAGDEVSITLGHNESHIPNAGFDQGQTIAASLTSGGTLLGPVTVGDVTNINGTATAADSDLTPSVISFTSDGTTAEILLTANGSTFVPMNGFTVDVIPEPSSLALLALGSIGFLRRRR
ncbi:PEP-CTERM sorting domain-containing protein [Roseibacillus persicicus]|uniref:PEP-CTERM sorting domain-containing protein n=1 Tax=Roseibacillus persicicus TaxID=454148 RepID=UPI00398B6AE9